MSDSSNSATAMPSKRQQRRQAARKYVYREPTIADRLAMLTKHTAALKNSAVATRVCAGLDAYFDATAAAAAAVKLAPEVKNSGVVLETEAENISAQAAATETVTTLVPEAELQNLNIRCLALGSPTESGIAMYQLALLILVAEWASPSLRSKRRQQKLKPTADKVVESDDSKPLDTNQSTASMTTTTNTSSTSETGKKKKKKSKEIKLTQLTPAVGPGTPAPSYKSLSFYTSTFSSEAAPPDLSQADVGSINIPLDVTITAYDPVFSDADRELFMALGIVVSEDHEFVSPASANTDLITKATFETTTIVYSIHAPPFLTESVLAATNLSDSNTNGGSNFVYIGNVLENYGTHLSSNELRARYPLIDSAVSSSPFPFSVTTKKLTKNIATNLTTATPWTWFPVPDTLSSNEPWMTAVNDLCVYWRNPSYQGSCQQPMNNSDVSSSTNISQD